MSYRTAADITREIHNRLGFLPPFFAPAMDSPPILDALWQQMQAAYLDNPIPEIFKERLAAALARFCSVPYCLLCHSSSLRPLGLKSYEVLELLQKESLSHDELLKETRVIADVSILAWPEPGSAIENAIHDCAVAIFLNQGVQAIHARLRRLLPKEFYDHLILFISYNRSCLAWAEAHPELDYRNDQRVRDHYSALVEEDPRLAEFFANYSGKVLEHTERRTKWITEENKSLLTELRTSREWLAATLNGIADAVIATDNDKQPRVTFLNGVAEKLTGWSAEDAKGRLIEEVFRVRAGERGEPAGNLLARVMASGTPFVQTQEATLLRRDETEFLVEDSASPIRNAVGEVQGAVPIFRDVTEKKKLEHERERLYLAEKQTRQDLEEFFVHSPLPMAILEGPEHFVLRANPPYEKLIGRKANHRPLLEVFALNEVADFLPHLDQVLKTGLPYLASEQPLSLRSQDGTVRLRWIDIGYHPRRGTDGKVKGILATVQDVTEAKHARDILLERESNFREFADSTPQIVFTTTADGNVDYINPRWYEFSLRSPEQTLGAAYISSIHPDDVSMVLSKWQAAVSTGKRFEEIYRFKRGSDDTYRWFTVCIEPKFENGKLKRWYGTLTDIHEQTEFAQKLSQARDEAEKANQTKSAFLANMSHEIRTPLGAILGFTDLLKAARLTGEEREYLDVIVRNGQALSHVINDILDLSKVEAGQLSIEYVPFELSELVKDVVTLFSDSARSKEISLRFESRPSEIRTVFSDPTRIRQILVNLIGNALKFTEKGSVLVALDMTMQDQSHSKIQIRVKDTGTGMTAAQAEKLFQPFVQADDSTTRKYGGTGLGLALSKRLAQALHGEVSIEQSQPEIGSTFLFEFIAQTVLGDATIYREDLAVPLPASSSSSLNNCSLLIVDDSPDNRVLLSLLLRRHGAKVDEAASGEEGVAKAIKNFYDLVLMDIQMPGMDGYDALSALQSCGYARPVIALTAHAMVEEKRRTQAAGFVDHVTKPISAKILIQAVKKHTSKNE